MNNCARGHANPITESREQSSPLLLRFSSSPFSSRPPPLSLPPPFRLPRPPSTNAAIIPQVFLDSFLSLGLSPPPINDKVAVFVICLSFPVECNQAGVKQTRPISRDGQTHRERLDPSASSHVSTHDNADNWSFKVELFPTGISPLLHPLACRGARD